MRASHLIIVLFFAFLFFVEELDGVRCAHRKDKNFQAVSSLLLGNHQTDKNEFDKELLEYNNVKDTSGSGAALKQPELLPTTSKVFSLPNYDTVICDSFCFSLWKLGDDEIRLQGCWDEGEDSNECEQSNCTAHYPPTSPRLRNNTRFCCCASYDCNSVVRDAVNITAYYIQLHQLYLNQVNAARANLNLTQVILIIVFIILFTILLLILTFFFSRFLRQGIKDCIEKANKEQQQPFLIPYPSDNTKNANGGVKGDNGVNYLRLGELISRGRYGDVYMAYLKDVQVVAKCYHSKYLEYFENEKTAFESFQPYHPYIVPYLGSLATEEVFKAGGNSFSYFIFTEYQSMGTLKEHLSKHTLTWKSFCSLCQCLSSALAYLHSDVSIKEHKKVSLAHRDINPRNILMKSATSCCIADFGFSIHQPHKSAHYSSTNHDYDPSTKKPLRNNAFFSGLGSLSNHLFHNHQSNEEAPENKKATLADVGTLRYMSPEVLEGAVNLMDPRASLTQVDMYAVGMVLWEMANRCSDLYADPNDVSEYKMVFEEELGRAVTFERMQVFVAKNKRRPMFPEAWISDNQAVKMLRTTMLECWDHDAEARISAVCLHRRCLTWVDEWYCKFNDKPMYSLKNHPNRTSLSYGTDAISGSEPSTSSYPHGTSNERSKAVIKTTFDSFKHSFNNSSSTNNNFATSASPNDDLYCGGVLAQKDPGDNKHVFYPPFHQSSHGYSSSSAPDTNSTSFPQSDLSKSSDGNDLYCRDAYDTNREIISDAKGKLDSGLTELKVVNAKDIDQQYKIINQRLMGQFHKGNHHNNVLMIDELKEEGLSTIYNGADNITHKKPPSLGWKSLFNNFNGSKGVLNKNKHKEIANDCANHMDACVDVCNGAYEEHKNLTS